MKMQRFGSFLVAYGLVAAIVVGCGGSSARRTQTPSDDAGTGNGGDSSETGGGHGGRAGAGGSAPKAGASNGGRGGSSAGSNATAGAPDDAGSGSVAADGGAGGSAGDGSAGEGGAGNEPVIDVGEGCIAPPSAPALSTATAGLPAAGLALWLRGDRGIYATEQQRVCAWADQSGNKLVLRATGAARPLWQTAGLGAQAAVDFDTASSYVAIGGTLGIAATSGRTFIAVVQSVDTSGRAYPVQQGLSNSPGTYVSIDTNTFQTAGNRQGVYVTNNSYDTALATSTAPRVLLFTIQTLVPGTPVLSAVEFRVNGAVQTLTRNDGGLGNGNIEDFSVADYTAVGSGAHSLIAEVLVYNRALSTEERVSVDAALRSRYGIQ
ncbi:MAG: hypothetical protein ABUL62_02560 [Myxococcales bacterium]